jgi:uncharacterized membrane protein
MTLFVILGAAAALVGLTMLVTALRGGVGEQPKSSAMLIGGMMLTAFGLVIAGFAIGYQRAAPLDLNTGAAK